MVLSEAIPITTTAWVSQAQPILRRTPRRDWRDSKSTGEKKVLPAGPITPFFVSQEQRQARLLLTTS